MKRKLVYGSIFLLLVSSILFINKNNQMDENLTKDDFYYREIERQNSFFQKIIQGFENQLATVVSSIGVRDLRVKVPVKFFRQEHPVTCEVAALRMALNYRGTQITEN